MANLPEDAGWVEGVRAIEETDPVRFDIYNESLSALASRTKYLQENMGQGGGAAVEWVEITGFTIIHLPALTQGAMNILDVRAGEYLEIRLVQSELEDFPIGTEYHFLCAGDPTNVYMLAWNGQFDTLKMITAAGLQQDYAGPVFNRNGSVATLKKISETEWILFGDLAEGDSEGFPNILPN